MAVTLHHGDCIEVMRGMADASVDAIVCDPPYDLTAGKKSGSGGFMGKAWDGTGVAFNVETWAEALRVLKPGGHLLAMGGTRTEHRMTSAIEDAGFEIRDKIAWIYGSGFPKNLNVSKAIQKQLPEDALCVCGQHSKQTAPDSQSGYLNCHHFGDAPPQMVEDADRYVVPSPSDVPGYNHDGLPVDVLASLQANTFADEDSGHPSSDDSSRRVTVEYGSQSAHSTPSGNPLSTSRDESMVVHRTGNRKSDMSHSGDGLASSSPLTPSGYENLPYCTTCGGVMVHDGLGTALKPAMEMIVLARKPFKGTVAANVLAHGTGALNIAACRIGNGNDRASGGMSGGATAENLYQHGTHGRVERATAGRWPANVILSETAARDLDAMSGVTKGGKRGPHKGITSRGNGVGTNLITGNTIAPADYPDTGGASRFFKVVAQDRSFTYNDVEEQECAACGNESTGAANTSAGKRPASNVDSLHIVGSGNKQTALSQTDTKSTTSTETPSTTTCPTCNASLPNGMTTITNGSEKTTESLMVSSADAVNGATNTDHLTNSSDVRQEATKATASNVPANTSKSGANETANTTTPTTAPIDSATNSPRFFYVAKASRAERRLGLPDDMQATHPTVKPLKLMAYLVRLITPPGGIVLDPFMGSGTTGCAALQESFRFIGIEQDAGYLEIAKARIADIQSRPMLPIEGAA